MNRYEHNRLLRNAGQRCLISDPDEYGRVATRISRNFVIVRWDDGTSSQHKVQELFAIDEETGDLA